jgi:hypothetical protein
VGLIASQMSPHAGDLQGNIFSLISSPCLSFASPQILTPAAPSFLPSSRPTSCYFLRSLFPLLTLILLLNRIHVLLLLSLLSLSLLMLSAFLVAQLIFLLLLAPFFPYIKFLLSYSLPPSSWPFFFSSCFLSLFSLLSSYFVFFFVSSASS